MESAYQQAKAVMDLDDNNYCVPVALALISGKSARDVNSSLMAKGRRRKGKGVHNGDWKAEMDEMGITYSNVTEKYSKNAGGRTVKSVVEVLDPSRKFLVTVRGHLLAVIHGKVEDWSEGRKHRVTEILEIAENGIIQSNFKPKARKQRDSSKLAGLEQQLSTLFYKNDDLAWNQRPHRITITGSWVKVEGQYMSALVAQTKTGYRVAFTGKSRQLASDFALKTGLVSKDSKSYAQFEIGIRQLDMVRQIVVEEGFWS